MTTESTPPSAATNEPSTPPAAAAKKTGKPPAPSDERNATAPAPATPLDEARAQLLLRRVIDIYKQKLADSKAARDALAARGCTDMAAIDRHAIGWCDDTLSKLLPAHGPDRVALTQLGILTEKGREKFANCLVAPLEDATGRILNLVGYPSGGYPRALPRGIGLWNIAAAKLAPQLYLSADVFDALAIQSAGFQNASALPHKGDVDVATLSAWGTQKIVVVVGEKFDANIDTVIAKTKPIQTTVARLKDCFGAADYARQHGPKALAEAIVAASHGLVTVNVPGMLPLPGGFTLTIGSRRYEVRGLEHSARRCKATVRAERGGKIHVDTLDLYQARARTALVRDAARFFEESSDLIEADVNKILIACETRAAQPDIQQALAPVEPVPEAARKEAEAMGKSPKLVQTIRDDLGKCGVVGEALNKVLGYVVMTSRKLVKPLALMTLSSSGAGKSTVQDAVCRLCPPEDLVKITSLSGRALHYKEEGSLQHKLLVVEESEGVQRAAYALRTLISSGEISTEVAVKDPASGKLTTMTNKVRGPVAVMLTTTSSDIDAETRSRFVLTNVDESPEQTRAIAERQRHEHSLDALAEAQEVDDVVARHHAFQRLLQPYRVVNPLIDRLGHFDGKLSARRDNPKILRLIESVALLRQMQKPVRQLGKVNYIEVDETDLAIAAELATPLLTRAAQEMSHPARELLGVLDTMRKRAGGSEDQFAFTRRSVREFSGWASARVHRYLSELIALEYVVRTSGRRGMREHYALEWDGRVMSPPLLFPFANLAGDSGSAPSGATKKAVNA